MRNIIDFVLLRAVVAGLADLHRTPVPVGESVLARQPRIQKR